MPWVSSFLEGLKTAATSPYAFVAYVCLLAGFIFYLVAELRLKAIAKLPAQEQAAVLEKEYKVYPRDGLSGEEWIRSRRLTLTFWAFVVFIVAAVLLTTIGILQMKLTSPQESPTETPADNRSPSNVNPDTTPTKLEKTPNNNVPIATTQTHNDPVGKSQQPVVVPPLDIPPIVNGGAPIGMTFHNRYLQNNVECMGETVKVSATEWQQRISSDSPASCNDGAVIFKFTERETKDSQYVLLYDEGRNLFARLPNIPVGQTGPSDWRRVSNQTWNESVSLTRVQ
jgi:hypothetical protein